MTRDNSLPFAARLAKWRVWVQATFLFAWLDPFALRLHTVCSPVFHCYSCPLATFACPIGVLANFSAIHVFPFIAVGTLAVTGALLGAFVCGWVCPFGLLQDLVGKIPTRKFELPGWLGYTRYAVLVLLVIAIPYWYGEGHRLFSAASVPRERLKPPFPIQPAWPCRAATLVWPSATKSIICGLFVVAMLFTWRPWCTLLCPLGAIYSLSNRVSFVFLRFHPSQCNDCDRCRSLCQYHARGERRGNDLRCIRCLDCTRCSAVTLDNVWQRGEPPQSDLVTLGTRSSGGDEASGV